VINEIYTDSFYKGYCNSLFYNEIKREELLSEFILAVLEMNQERVKELIDRKEFKYYAISIIRNLAFNKNSSFNKNNTVALENDIIEDENLEQPVYFEDEKAKELKKCIYSKLLKDSKKSTNLWYEKEIFFLYHNEFKSYREMSKATGIPVSSIHNSVIKTTEKIKEQFKDRFDKLKDELIY
jgi:DNA-directed RNA polymerase specialized sigma24 family protein